MLPVFFFMALALASRLCNKTGSQQRLLAAVHALQLISAAQECDATKHHYRIKSPAHKNSLHKSGLYLHGYTKQCGTKAY